MTRQMKKFLKWSICYNDVMNVFKIIFYIYSASKVSCYNCISRKSITNLKTNKIVSKEIVNDSKAYYLPEDNPDANECKFVVKGEDKVNENDDETVNIQS